MRCQLLDVEQKAPRSVSLCCEVTSVEEGHVVECVTEMMQLFSAAQQRRVNVVTCILVRRHVATSQEGVMNFPPQFRAFSFVSL